MTPVKDKVSALHRKLQKAQDASDAKARKEQRSSAAVQAGRAGQPENPMPSQHLAKPGSESEMEMRPHYLAPDYRGSGKLEGMAALVTGGDSGIGRAVAVLFAREGADVAVAYLDEHPDAEETKAAVEAEGRRCLLLPGDVRDPAFCRDAIDRTVEAFGKLDILVNNAASSCTRPRSRTSPTSGST